MSNPTCPECGDPFDGGLSGNVENHVSDSITTDLIGRICIVGPDDEHPITTVYFHPDSYLQTDATQDQ